MSGRVTRSIYSTANKVLHFKRQLKQKQYKVNPPPKVPNHIVKPQYAQSTMPIFAQYDGLPPVRTKQQIQKIKYSAKVASSTLHATQQWLIQKGKQDLQNKTDGTLTGQDIDKFVFDYIVNQNAYPTPIGFMGFPKSVCLSVNQCVVHGIPDERPVYLGDKLNMDVTAYYDGFHGDTNLSIVYGGKQQSLTPQLNKIIELTQKALYKAISICKPGVKYNQIGITIQKFAKQHGIHVCPHFTGHGVGHLLHLPPMVHHVPYPMQNHIMQVGNVFTIQPVMSIYQSTNGLTQWKDNFTIISQNNPNAQFEHMVSIVQGGCQVLTQRVGENIPNPNGNIKNLTIY